jgi:hypothetical protein
MAYFSFLSLNGVSNPMNSKSFQSNTLNLKLFSLMLALSLPANLAWAGDLHASPTPTYTRTQSPEITVYNQNFAMVKDYRQIPLEAGNNQILMDDVAGLIDPTSVLFKSITAPQKVVVKEQNFRYDLISKTAILDRMVGKTIRFRKDNVIKEGILLNPATTYARDTSFYYNGYQRNSMSPMTASDYAIQTSEGILLTNLGDILVEEIPEGLYPRPTLAWILNTSQAGSHQTQVSYLTDGLNWNCDYVAILSQDDKSLDLQSWVTVKNFSAATYPNSHLKLVAGDVNRVQPQQNHRYMTMKASVMEDMAGSAEPQFKEEGLFEYHMYTLNGTTTLANNEIKQLSLVTANSIPVEKQFIYDPDRQGYVHWDGYTGSFNYYYNKSPGQGSGTSPYKKVNVSVKFKNTEANRLGIPLPKGKIRVNKADSSGAVQFIGEDQIDHTPKDEWINLYLGDAFDVVAEKKSMKVAKDPNWVEETYQVTLKNHKKEKVTVAVYEHAYGVWKVKDVTPKFEAQKMDSRTVKFDVPVPADGETVLTYTVRIDRN